MTHLSGDHSMPNVTREEPAPDATSEQICLAECLKEPGVNAFAIVLYGDGDGWKASALSASSRFEAIGRSPAQALRGMARVINRHLHRHHRRRPVLGMAESDERALPSISVSANGL
jgi:hypothetical protein